MLSAKYIAHIKGQATRVLIMLLIAAVSIGSIPVFSFHDHHEETCDENNAALENDPCHISIYHHLVSDKGCDHQKHIDTKKVECKLCKVVTGHYEAAIITDHHSSFIRIQVPKEYMRCDMHLIHATLGCNLNKGPPAVAAFC
jgi:hypothetical protein